MSWPPQIGERLPHASEVVGVRQKLASYSLNPDHPSGGAKAKGLSQMLGVTLRSIDYLEREILKGIGREPIRSVRARPPFGIICVVDCPIRGLGVRGDRVVPLRTAWLLPARSIPPRLTSAYLKP